MKLSLLRLEISVARPLVIVTSTLVLGSFACSSSKHDAAPGTSSAGDTSVAGDTGVGGNSDVGGSSATADTNAPGGTTSLSNSTGGTGIAGGSSTATTGGGSSGTRVLGENCSAGCTLSPCGLTNETCSTGYCVWESRFLPYQAYCTEACSGIGAACPLDYECVADVMHSGKFWCVKPKPEPPADFGEPCSDSFNLDDCLLQDAARECAARFTNCEQWCARGPGGAAAACTMDCSATLACPQGYDCRDTPVGSTSEQTCFKSYAPSDVLGSHCEPDATTAYFCGADPASCVNKDSYGLCDCLYDKRDATQRSKYCTIPCVSDCPTGYVCDVASNASTKNPTGMYCYVAR